MGPLSPQEHLYQVLIGYVKDIQDTLEAMDRAPASSLKKVSWSQVVQIGQQLSKEATMVGVLWGVEKPELKSLEDNMASFFGSLQGLLLLAHGSTVGAGRTLSYCIHAAVKAVVDSSINLMKESVACYGSLSGMQKVSIPQMVGTVWESCAALRKTPSSNITAIGQALTRITVAVKDVLRETKQLKEASSDVTEEEDNDKAPSEADSKDESDDDFDADFDGDLGNDLSPEEMKIAQSSSLVVSETLDMINKLIRSIIGLLRQENQGALVDYVDTLEKLLRSCHHVGTQIEELGACLYPPQEIRVMKGALVNIGGSIDDIQLELEKIGGSSEDFVQTCTHLKSLIRKLDLELGCSNATDLVPHMENLGV